MFGVILIINRSAKTIGWLNKFNNSINYTAITLSENFGLPNKSILDKVEESKGPEFTFMF